MSNTKDDRSLEGWADIILGKNSSKLINKCIKKHDDIEITESQCCEKTWNVYNKNKSQWIGEIYYDNVNKEYMYITDCEVPSCSIDILKKIIEFVDDLKKNEV